MTVMIQGDEVRAITQGILVHRDSATIAADQDLFSVDGGRVILLGLVGRVTVEIGGGSQDIELDLDPDGLRTIRKDLEHAHGASRLAERRASHVDDVLQPFDLDRPVHAQVGPRPLRECTFQRDVDANRAVL